MAVRKRGNVWWYDFTVKGKRYRKPIPEARTKKKAEEVEDKMKVSVYDGTYDKPNPKTLAAFIDEDFWPWALANYRTPKMTHHYHVQVVKQAFGHKTLQDISYLDVERFKREKLAVISRFKRPLAPATINHFLETLSRILSMACDAGLVKENPCSRVKLLRTDNQRTRYLETEEEERLLAHLQEHFPSLRRVVLFALHTGMRRGEIVRLSWADVDRVRGLINVRKTKNGKDRIVPINSIAASVLDEAATLNLDKPTVFEIAAQTVSDYFRKSVKKLKLNNLCFHDLRHSFATRLGDAGMDAFTIAELTGHSDLKMVKRYTHALDVNKRRAVESLVSGHANVTVFENRGKMAG